MSKKVVIGIIIVIVLALVLYWVYKANQSIAPQSPVKSQNVLNQNKQAPTTASVQPQTTPESNLQTLDSLDKEYDSSFNQEMQNMDTEINKL
jgi:predicted Holliday junction resolvase-like endonuclease